MEDDIEFNPRINDVLDKAMKQIPDYWESIFFGLSSFQTVPVTKNIHLIKSGWSAHCFALNKVVFQYIIEILSSLDDPADIKYCMYLFPRGKSYVIKPFLAWQRPSLSNIRGSYSNHEYLKPPETLKLEEITELCTKVHVFEDNISLLEDNISLLEDKLKKMEGELREFPLREAKNIHSFINNKIPVGSKRRSLARLIYHLFRK
jgi:hypothetical protein